MGLITSLSVTVDGTVLIILSKISVQVFSKFSGAARDCMVTFLSEADVIQVVRNEPQALDDKDTPNIR